MNLKEQFESSGDPKRGGITLDTCTMDDLVNEIKMRCSSMMLVCMMQDEDGDDRVVVSKRGSTFEVIGMLETMRHDMLKRNTEPSED